MRSLFRTISCPSKILKWHVHCTQHPSLPQGTGMIFFSRDCASVCTVTSTFDTLFERWLPSASNSVAKKSRLVKFFPRQKTYWLLLVEKKAGRLFLCEKSAASPGEANVSATYRYIWCNTLVQNIWCKTLVQYILCKTFGATRWCNTFGAKHLVQHTGAKQLVQHAGAKDSVQKQSWVQGSGNIRRLARFQLCTLLQSKRHQHLRQYGFERSKALR